MWPVCLLLAHVASTHCVDAHVEFVLLLLYICPLHPKTEQKNPHRISCRAHNAHMQSYKIPLFHICAHICGVNDTVCVCVCASTRVLLHRTIDHHAHTHTRSHAAGNAALAAMRLGPGSALLHDGGGSFSTPVRCVYVCVCVRYLSFLRGHPVCTYGVHVCVFGARNKGDVQTRSMHCKCV